MVPNSEEHKAFSIEWRDAFKINLPLIDQEHRHLFTLVKALNLASVDQTVDELLDYVVTHFTHEQELMEQHRYPAFEEHLKLHESFSASVADFLSSGEPWTEQRIQDLRRFLNRWLIGHIMTHDLRFGKWMETRKSAMATAQAARPQPVAERKGLLARWFGRG